MQASLPISSLSSSTEEKRKTDMKNAAAAHIGLWVDSCSSSSLSSRTPRLCDRRDVQSFFFSGIVVCCCPILHTFAFRHIIHSLTRSNPRRDLTHRTTLAI